MFIFTLYLKSFPLRRHRNFEKYPDIWDSPTGIKTRSNLNTKEPTVYQHFRDSKQQQYCVAQNSQSCFQKFVPLILR